MTGGQVGSRERCAVRRWRPDYGMDLLASVHHDDPELDRNGGSLAGEVKGHGSRTVGVQRIGSRSRGIDRIAGDGTVANADRLS